MAKKFVINNNQLVLGNVEFHIELCKDNSKTIGGGFWHVHEQSQTIIFYGLSSDFGPVTKEQFNNADKFPYGDKMGLFFSREFELASAVADFEKQHAPVNV